MQSKLIGLSGLTVVALAAVGPPFPFALRLAAATFLALFWPGWLLLRLLSLPDLDRPERWVLAAGLSYGLVVVGSLGALYLWERLSTLIVIGLVGLLNGGLLAANFLRSGERESSSRPAGPETEQARRSWPPDRGPETDDRRDALNSRSSIPASRSEPVDHGGPLWRSQGFREALHVAIPVAVAALFSLTNLGYADYWGDEMNGLLRAMAVIGGRPETLFEHTKGPVEVLLPAVFGLLAGRFEPFTVRFPFAVAHIVGVGGYYLLGRRLVGRPAGLIAALLLALNGLYLAFGRIVQYQAVVFMMTALALLLAYHFYQTGRGRYLHFGAFLGAGGLLAHYDMLLVLPPLAYLVWLRCGRRWSAWRAAWPQTATAGLIGLVTTIFFYGPFFFHPHLAETSSYLSRIIGVSNWPAANFDQLYVFAVMYNSRYYVAFIALLGAGLIAVHLTRLFRDRYRAKALWVTVIAGLALCLAILLLNRSVLAALLLTLLVFVLLVGFSSLRPELKLVYVWLGVSFTGYVFFIDHPRTHLQIIYPGWSLLAALALTGTAARLRERLPRPALAGAAALLVLLFGFFAYYQYLLFVDSRREYIFTYPAHKRALYWEDADFPFGSRRLYGAPHRLGWQMVNDLYARGRLAGDWHSNDEGSNLFWYTLGTDRNPCYPHYYFLTQFDQKDDSDDDENLIPDGYVSLGQVWNRDRLQVDIYEFAPLAQPAAELTRWSEPAAYQTAITPGDFRSWPYQDEDQADQPEMSRPLAEAPRFRPGPAALEQIATHYNDSRIVNVRDQATLLGYDLDETWAEPGGAILLTLYWQAIDVINLPYKIFVHLESQSGSETLAQADDFPACGTRPTQRWTVGETVVDRHLVRLPADIPPGLYTLTVGLYEPQTGLRMDLLDVMDNPQGNSFELTPVVIRAANSVTGNQ